VLLHLGCALLAFWLFDRWFARTGLAFAVAAIFAAHPINTNAVTYVAGRADSMALLGMLGALACLDRYVVARRLGWFIGAVLAATAAMFSRENALLLPVLIFWVAGTVWREKLGGWRGALKLALLFALLATGFYLLRHEMLSWQGRSTRAVWHLPAMMRVMVALRALGLYAGLIFWPAHLQMERQVLFGPHLLWLAIAGSVVVVGLVLALWRGSLPVRVGAGWFVLLLAPMLGLFNLNATFAEHWVYAGSLGFYLAVAALWPQRFGWVIGVVLLALAARTHFRNRDWSSPARFYATTTVSAPYSASARVNLAMQLGDRRNTAAAREEFAAAEQMAPGYSRAKTAAARFLLADGDLPAARRKIEESLALSPHSTDGLLMAAGICEEQQDWRAAERYFARSLGTTTNVRPWLQYGDFLRERGRLREALSLADGAVALEPGSEPSWNLRGAVLAEMNDWAGAEKAFRRACRCDRRSADPWVNLGRLALRQNRPLEAGRHLERALAMNSGDATTRFQLARAWWLAGRSAEAIRELENVLAEAPTSDRARLALEKARRGEATAFD
jgi:tetratricopeptide (TPR) repeat protein